MKPVETVHFVMPVGVDDPARPSGGNVYDRRLCSGLAELGWDVREHQVSGDWPHPAKEDETGLTRVLDAIPTDALVVVDGLIGCATPVVAQHAARLRVVMLVHMPLAEREGFRGSGLDGLRTSTTVPDPTVVEGRGAPATSLEATTERAALAAADVVVTPSRWARDWLLDHHGVAADKVLVIRPGVDPGQPAAPSTAGGRMLYVAAVTPAKGHDTLVAALTEISDLDWHCTCAGALDVDPGFATDLRVSAERAGLADRLSFPGPLSRAALDEARSATDLAVSPSRRESYGMATAEALARGIPVVATAVGGQPEAIGSTGDEALPGLLVPPEDPDALAAALRHWLTDASLRATLRRAAVRRSADLPTWQAVATRFAAVLTGREPEAER